MSDAPIRAALETAAKAVDTMPMPSVSSADSIRELSRELARVGIIAFLRALPDKPIRLPGDAGWLLPYFPRALADAVERAVAEADAAAKGLGQ